MKLGSILLLMVYGFICSALMADSAYIYDKNKGLWSLRGAAKDFKVDTKYPPGSLFKIIAGQEKNGYSLVGDENGHQSWILSSHLLPVKSIELDKALLDIQQLKTSHEGELKKLQSALNARAPLEKVNQKLQSKIAKMQIDLEQLEHINNAFTNSFNREVFFAGGTTIIAGIFFGWLIFSGGRKKNDAWN